MQRAASHDWRVERTGAGHEGGPAGQTTIGVVVAFVSGLDRVSAPLHDLLNFYRAYEQAKVQHQMIVEWVEGEPGE